jgi:hypothetical protein
MTLGVGRVGWRNFVSTVPTTPSIITTGLVLNLDASNPLSYSGTGTTWTDLSGNGNNVTLYNGASYSSANSGTMVFDGINDYGRLTYNSNFNLSNTESTLEVWFNSNSFATEQILLSKDTYGSNFDWCLRITDSTHLSILTNRTFINATTTIPALSVNTWYHFAITTIDRGDGYKNVRIYLNGVLVGGPTLITSGLTNESQSYITIGCASWNNPGVFTKGKLPVIRIYRSGLTATEVLQNFDALKARYGYGTYTARTTAFATATGITDTTILNALNTFDTGLISNGLDTKMKALYPFVGGTAVTHKFNFMDARDVDAAFRLTFYGGGTHGLKGYTGNGTNAFAQTYLNALTYISPSDNSLSIYRQNIASKNECYIRLGGATSGTMYMSEIFYYSPWITIASSGTNEQAVVDNSKGFYMANRNVNNLSLFRNTTKTSFVDNFTAQRDTSYIIGNGNDTQYWFNNTLSFIHIGNNLNDTDQTTFYNLVQALQTTLGRAV